MNAADWYKQNKDRLGKTLSKKEFKEAADAGIKKKDLQDFVSSNKKIGVEQSAIKFLENKYNKYKSGSSGKGSSDPMTDTYSGVMGIDSIYGDINADSKSDDPDRKALADSFRYDLAGNVTNRMLDRADQQFQTADNIKFNEASLDQRIRETKANYKQEDLFQKNREAFQAGENALTRTHEFNMNKDNNQTLRDVTDAEVQGRTDVATLETKAMVDVADKQLTGTKHVADQQLAGTKYGADKSLEGIQYQADSAEAIASTQKDAATEVASTQKDAATEVATTQAGAAKDVATTQAGAQTTVASTQKQAAEAVAKTQAGAATTVATTQAGAATTVASTQGEAAKEVAKTQAGAATTVASTRAGADKDIASTQADATKYVADRGKEQAFGVADRSKEQAFGVVERTGDQDRKTIEAKSRADTYMKNQDSKRARSLAGMF